MPRLLKAESPRHLQAFERYFAMGQERSYARLAAELGVDEDTVKLWGRSFRWQERLDARDRDVAHQAREQGTRTAVIDRVKRRRAAEMGFVEWVNNLRAGKLKPKFSDLKDIVQMMESEDRGLEKGALTLNSTPEEIVAFLGNLSTQELDEVVRLCRARDRDSGALSVHPDGGTIPNQSRRGAGDTDEPE